MINVFCFCFSRQAAGRGFHKHRSRYEILIFAPCYLMHVASIPAHAHRPIHNGEKARCPRELSNTMSAATSSETRRALDNRLYSRATRREHLLHLYEQSGKKCSPPTEEEVARPSLLRDSAHAYAAVGGHTAGADSSSSSSNSGIRASRDIRVVCAEVKYVNIHHTPSMRTQEYMLFLWWYVPFCETCDLCTRAELERCTTRPYSYLFFSYRLWYEYEYVSLAAGGEPSEALAVH